MEISGKGIKVVGVEKMLYSWATFRNLEKDIIYKTNVSKGISQIEGEMPPEIIFGAFSAFSKKYKNLPADYDKIYVYIQENELDKIWGQFIYIGQYLNRILIFCCYSKGRNLI